MKGTPLRPDTISEATAMRPREARHLIFADAVLCRLQAWTEEEWLALPASGRPLRYVHVPGLGWVGAVRLEPTG